MDIEEAIIIAKLWRDGKMIGGNEDDVRDALLSEVETLRARVAELELYEPAFKKAEAFINSHVADPDLTDEMCKTYDEYMAACMALERSQ